MKMDHVSAIPIPKGTLQLEITVKGVQDGQPFAYQAMFNEEEIEIFKDIEKDRIDSIVEETNLNVDEPLFAITAAGKARIEEIETAFYTPIQ